MRIVIGTFIPEKPGRWSVNLVDNHGEVHAQGTLDTETLELSDLRYRDDN